MAKNLIISTGNKKVPYANISTTPIKTCINCKECKKKCYALKSYRMYPAVRKAWDSNSKLMRNNLQQVYNDLNGYLERYKKDFFRYNVAGDIMNNKQFNVYKKIAGNYPNIMFLSFTKNYTLNFNNIPDNYSLVLSVWTGMSLPEIDIKLPMAFLSNDDRKVNTLKCIGTCGTCGMCWHLKGLNKNVCFDLH